MTRWTQQQYEDYILSSKNAIAKPVALAEQPNKATLEHNLLAKCLRYCRDYGYAVWHDWSRKKNEAGWPDLMIFMSEGRVCLIELKSEKGRLRKEQADLRRHLLFLGHPVHVVKSYKRFLEVIQDRT
uniref:Putative VRR-NUC domain-containing protein n=1 Tax=viral metagenome TaxID=1070528 RepID=A0A6H2A0C5_9ZZZZ